MFGIFGSRKGKGKKRGKHRPKKDKKAAAAGNITIDRKETRTSGGIVQPTPPVIVKKKAKAAKTIKTSDVAKIWKKG